MTAEPITQKFQARPDTWLDRPVFAFWPNFSIEKLIVVLLIVLTLVSRFYDLGARVMSHDEVNHVVPAYDLYQGRGYRYDPVTHGPFQFHMIAFSYFMFGDSDFSARIPAALFGVGIVLFTIFAWRRLLGRVGALMGGLLFAISPYMLFYSRYTRNEIFIVFWGVVMLWTFLRYLEGGEKKFLILLTLITAFHYTDKATSYIFTAEALIFLAFLFIWEVNNRKWLRENLKFLFFILMILAMVACALGLITLMRHADEVDATTGQPSTVPDVTSQVIMIAGLVIAVVAGGAAIYFLVRGLGMPHMRDMRSFDLLILQLSLILPLLSSLFISVLGFNPLDYTQAGMLRSAIIVIPLALLSILMGLFWNRRVWLQCAILFWSIFIIFYTTIFSQGDGFFVGIMGALGYWMAQQGVQRGTQPLYYYALVQIPIYEYLPALGTLLALIIGFAKGLFISKPEHPFEVYEHEPLIDEAIETLASLTLTDESLQAPEPPTSMADLSPALQSDLAELPASPNLLERLFSAPPDNTGQLRPVPTLILLLFWCLISLVAFSLAGERMPWLTTHIAMPLILSSAWGLGYLVKTTDWHVIFRKKGLLVFLLGLLFMMAISSAFGTLLGSNPPFRGKELAQLQATSTFMLSALASFCTGAGLIWLLKDWVFSTFTRLLILSGFLILGILTFRTAFRAVFINYDNAKEYLVYAHATRNMKDILEQVETISARLYGDKSIAVAYDNNSLYPFWWYFRDYANKRWFADSPTKDLRNSPVILVGTESFAKIEPIVANDYYQFDYKRMWWPMEDYRNQTFQSLWEMLKNPDIRAGLWQIWFNRDYSLYAQATGRTNLTLATWSPSDAMRMYIRKDIAAQIWEYGLAPIPVEPKVDPYEGATISLKADVIISSANGTSLQAPRGLAFAPDGSFYVADSRNHRIIHFDANGAFLHTWGSYANVLDGAAPAGLFNEPWSVAVSPDGSVYVADTWNHRIQKFTAEGQFVTLWEVFGPAEAPDSFWGPRGLAIDSMGRVYVTDTGKQRVVIFDADGSYLTQFGGLGLIPGSFDEPVGIAVDDNGLVYIADTWNNRIQIMAPSLDYLSYSSILSWDVDAWYTQSLDNKPFLALNAEKQIFVTDPDLGRIIQFDSQGNFLQLWGGYDNAILIGIASGVAVDPEGRVWISDALNNTLLQFSPPEAQPATNGNLLPLDDSGN